MGVGANAAPPEPRGGVPSEARLSIALRRIETPR